MKLKYYLRGLAAGILLTTILLTIANAGDRPLTDAQIRQRALQLGMIDSDSVRLSALQGSGATAPESDSSSASDSSVTDSSINDSSVSDSNIPDRTESDSGSLSDASESDTAESDTSSETTQPSEKVNDTTEASLPQEASGEPDAEPVSFQVKSGATSSTVSRELAAAGLIEDAAAFDTFLCNNGYSKRIRAGTYKIAPGTSEEDIAKIITQQS